MLKTIKTEKPVLLANIIKQHVNKKANLLYRFVSTFMTKYMILQEITAFGRNII